MSLSRRSILAGAAASTLAMPAIAQTRNVSFTLSWLAQGSSCFPYVGRAKGFFKSRGFDLTISRGFGSLPAAQAIGAGKFDFGLVIASPTILLVGKGLPLAGIATVDYDGMMGVAVLADSPIKSPKELAGKKIDTVVASAESPLFPAYAKLAGFDLASVEMINTDPNSKERLLIGKQVDAMTGLAWGDLAVLLSQGIEAHWFLYSSVGLPGYGQAVVTTQAMVDKDPGLCAAVTEGLMESLAFTLTNPEETQDLFFKAVPELVLNRAAQDFQRIGMALYRIAIAQKPAQEHGLGWGDPAVYDTMTDLMMKYASGPDVKRPAVESWYTNRFAGTVKLSPAQWDAVGKGLTEYKSYFS